MCLSIITAANINITFIVIRNEREKETKEAWNKSLKSCEKAMFTEPLVLPNSVQERTF